MSFEAALLGAFEEHSPEGIQEALTAGANPTELIKGKRPVDCLIEGYLRSDRFHECLRILLGAGASVGDPLLQTVLMDDDEGLRRLLNESGVDIQQKMTPCARSRPAAVSRLFILAPSSIPCGVRRFSWTQALT